LCPAGTTSSGTVTNTNTAQCAGNRESPACAVVNNPPIGQQCDPSACHFCTGAGCPGGQQTITCTRFTASYFRQLINQCGGTPAHYEPASCLDGSRVDDRTEIPCNPATGSTCGNGICNAWENNNSCPEDCPLTGNSGPSTGGPENPPPSTQTGSIDLLAYPYSRSIYNGYTTAYAITVAPVNYSGPDLRLDVGLSVSRCPTGATCTISGGSNFQVGFDDTIFRTLTVTANNVTSRVNNILINATYGGQFTRQVSVDLIVEEPERFTPSVWMDHPVMDQSVSDRLYIWGWAIDNETQAEGSITSRKVYLDNQYIGDANTYSRPDVCAVWPGRSGCPNVGYEFNFDTKDFSNGVHTLKVVVTDSDSPAKSSSVQRAIYINNSQSKGTIFGYKLNGIDLGTNTNPPINQTVRLNGGQPTTANGYNFSDVSLDSNQTVTVDVPTGWSVGYTLCYGVTTCHGETPTPGNTAVVNIPRSLPTNSRFAHLWWHFTPPNQTNTPDAPPSITLNGSNPISVRVGETFNDPGATAYDQEDGNITNRIVSSNDISNSVGTYTVTYSVTDSVGHIVFAYRTVNRVSANNTTPSITLLGSNPLNLTVGQTFNDPGATAYDPEDGDITSSIVRTGTINTSTAGNYTRYYNVTDSRGGSAPQVTRVVNVSQPTPNYTLTITRPLGGVVNSNVGGIGCGATCSAVYQSGTTVVLTAVPQSGWRFVGWTGDCSGTSICTIVINGSKNVGALFRPQPFQYREF
jgi:hypothetical protein